MAYEDIRLADAVRALRRELTEAQTEGIGTTLRFDVGPIEVEFAVTVTKDAEVEGGVRLGVVTIGAKGGVSSDSSHRVTVVLTPTDTNTGRPPQVDATIEGIPDR